MTAMEQWPGKAYPLGATHDGSGTTFAIFSEVAERVELCLFDADGAESRVPLIEVDGFIWHGFLPAVEPGQGYGYRVRHRRPYRRSGNQHIARPSAAQLSRDNASFARSSDDIARRRARPQSSR